jgi:hypothetical protein
MEIMYKNFQKGNTPFKENQEKENIMAKAKKEGKPLTPQEQLKFEIAQELGLDKKVLERGWRSLTAKESGKIGGLMTKRKREMKAEALKGEEK